jgi:hypothetical protein
MTHCYQQVWARLLRNVVLTNAALAKYVLMILSVVVLVSCAFLNFFVLTVGNCHCGGCP